MVTGTYGHDGQRAARLRLDSILCRIRLPASVSAPFFPKKAWIILCKTDPDPIWMAWSGFGQTRLVWKQAGVQESSGPVSGRTQPARYQFPTLRLDSVLPQTARVILKLGTRRTAETATKHSHQRVYMHVFHVPFTSITHAASYRVKFRR